MNKRAIERKKEGLQFFLLLSGMFTIYAGTCFLIAKYSVNIWS